ncbi:hypothetical protein BCR41DRAFT_38293 [Lobosporangium transversale]|uniref:Secreted protein n=1 Tax=Lobosporangium transversale TaxID=64571 RepID=A0A1Y2GQ93_9FUNG|nr:hypothetical protein BCR41DRAFT_38293 [Lobosporangium transversale]ORZ19086.1 hypothetical protein BCR41DRAFT_38293 [Lobosporangium transversale]|eukprot:XP_021882254.1 hypothetical protein BCR41DRAFT_38293 [Lobosporangium transversale]
MRPIPMYTLLLCSLGCSLRSAAVVGAKFPSFIIPIKHFYPCLLLSPCLLFCSDRRSLFLVNSTSNINPLCSSPCCGEQGKKNTTILFTCPDLFFFFFFSRMLGR